METRGYKSTTRFHLKNANELKCPKEKRYALTREPKVTCLKKPVRHFNDGRAFNTRVSYYFFNSYATFLFLAMVEHNFQGQATTLKDFSADVHMASLGRQLLCADQRPSVKDLLDLS